ncbi:site-2 protease family protein [Vibrio ziniensis]|uniref:Site-2 protease family protein n=1 Tax=Vibrio ziniensis TaxID=2711221 RepID=A0A6G7CQ33_9VIBR|nr:site-2 protease family protein [Vibrio ziniensis]QIH44200.1 site-2 protease family protein [Vibrio ziniensis]
MELLSTELFGKPLRLEGSMAGWQQLFWNNTLISQREAQNDDSNEISHHFKLQKGEQLIECRLEVDLTWQPFSLAYRIVVDELLVEENISTVKDIERQVPVTPPPVDRRFSLIGVVSLGMKALKSAKLIKVLLASASLAAYSWLFSYQFAIALILCLVFHEYGHVKAMKYFGMRTKGIYLVPFLGGLALSDEKINTRWQDVVISIMGPCFGFILSLVFVMIYWMTGSHLWAALAAFNAFLNLFNLLPILPLDGGHVLKSISFSMNSRLGMIICLATIVGGIALSYSLGLTLLGFLLVMGSLDLVFEWKNRHHSHLLPLDRYGQVVSTVWYIGLLVGLISIIVGFATTGDTLLSLPLLILGT